MSKLIAVFVIVLSSSPAFAGTSSAAESASAMASGDASAKPAKVKKPKKVNPDKVDASAISSAPAPK